VPAINPNHLKQQAVHLAEHFADSDRYIRNLHDLFEFYSNRARRPGQSGKPRPLIQAYNVSPPVLRQILNETSQLAQENPGLGLDLCDALWEQPYLEFRQLSAMLLGEIPPSPPETITNRVRSWLSTDLEEYLISTLLTQALDRVRNEEPQVLIDLIQEWLDYPDDFYNHIGLQALILLIQDPKFENIPSFYRLIQPLARSSHANLHPDLLDVLEALAQRSPQETSFFLRKTLDMPNADDTPWLIRQTLHAFPPDIQENLRAKVRGIK
jgi:hypothetical protein